MYKASFEVPIVPQRFISVVPAESDRSAHLPLPSASLISYSHSPPPSFIYLPFHSNRLLQWHGAQVKTHCLSAWWMDQWRRERRSGWGGVEEEKVTVFPESKPPVFDHGECCCWSLRCVLSLTSHGWLAGWTWWGFGVCGAGGGGVTRCYMSSGSHRQL